MSQQNTTRNLRLDEDATIQTGEAVTFTEGAHRGIVTSVYGEKTPEGYYYIQFDLKPEENPDTNIRYGCPYNPEKVITPNSKLGHLLTAWGFDMSPGNNYSIRQMRNVIEGKEATWMMRNEPSKKDPRQFFATVIEKTLKPRSPPKRAKDADE